MDINEFQKLMKELYFANDSQRGLHRTALWLVEEVGELMAELKYGTEKVNIDHVKEEMADIYAWVASLANLLKIDLTNAIEQKYTQICPRCKNNPCCCRRNLP